MAAPTFTIDTDPALPAAPAPAVAAAAPAPAVAAAAPAPAVAARKQQRMFDIFGKAMLTRTLMLSLNNVGANIKQVLEEKLKMETEGRCIKEGFVKRGSTRIVTYSCGVVNLNNMIAFEVVFEALVCCPVEGMLIECVATTITKAGIKAELPNITPSPIVLFVARDHFHKSDYFSKVKEDDEITVRVIGQRYELNDSFISIIGELVPVSRDVAKITGRTKLKLAEDASAAP